MEDHDDEDGGDDFDERERFENLLEEVDAVADPSTEHDSEGGQGCLQSAQSTTSNRRTRPKMRWLGF